MQFLIGILIFLQFILYYNITLKDRIHQIKKQHPALGYKSIAKIIGCVPNTVRFHLQDSCKIAMYKRHARYRGGIRKEFKLKAGGKCVKCGYDKYLEVLDFHHRHRSEKKFSIAHLLINKGRKIIEKEIKKCDLLCANCHRELHIEEGTLGKKTNLKRVRGR